MCCDDRSYFSRLCDAERFKRFIGLASGEIHRRRVETAGIVAGVVDGAAWCQDFLDAHRPDAVRILDFPHAAQRLSAMAEAVWGRGETARAWAAAQRAELRDGVPEAMLAAIQAAPLGEAQDAVEAAHVHAEVLGYLEPRRDQMCYAAFRAQGLPIGSGIVESANKTVVETRMKGAGRRWDEAHVNPMVTLRGRSAPTAGTRRGAGSGAGNPAPDPARVSSRPGSRPPRPQPPLSPPPPHRAPCRPAPPSPAPAPRPSSTATPLPAIPGNASLPSHPRPQNFDAHPPRSQDQAGSGRQSNGVARRTIGNAAVASVGVRSESLSRISRHIVIVVVQLLASRWHR
ncbi:MAG: hypothetical protein IT338_14095 [Thermomicrobiales bacterium]|nr:hypothetical protein [Thermomicrobiales bacterium]